MQAEGANLVTLDDTNASAVLQKDGTVVCTHELLSPIGSAMHTHTANYPEVLGEDTYWIMSEAGVSIELYTFPHRQDIKWSPPCFNSGCISYATQLYADSKCHQTYMYNRLSPFNLFLQWGWVHRKSIPISVFHPCLLKDWWVVKSLGTLCIFQLFWKLKSIELTFEITMLTKSRCELNDWRMNEYMKWMKEWIAKRLTTICPCSPQSQQGFISFFVIMFVCHSLSLYTSQLLLNYKNSLSANHPAIYFLHHYVSPGCKANNNIHHCLEWQ